LFYGSEIGTTFYQNETQLDFISRQVFKAAKYLAGFADSLMIVTEGVVPPPVIYSIGQTPSDFSVTWHAKNVEHNNPLYWELLELSNPSIIEDDLETGTDRWLLQGFTLSTTQAHSGTHSYFSGSVNEMNNAVQSIHPLFVNSEDSVTFWCRYDLETNYDVAVVEVSENTKEWFSLDTTRFNGNSGGWIRKAYSLEDWVGRSVYIRFRAMTDGAVLNTGFYVDDIYPTCLFNEMDTVAADIADTTFDFLGHPSGEYYYVVRGYNSTWGWGDYSCLAYAEVMTGIDENEVIKPEKIVPSLSLGNSLFTDRLQIKYTLGEADIQAAHLRIYDAAGRLIKDLSAQLCVTGNPSTFVWDGRDASGKAVPSGIYFVKLDWATAQTVSKAILLR
jgi:hypothetical protein